MNSHATNSHATNTTENAEQVISRVNFNTDGLVPAIIQDDHSGEVLMLAYMNDEALRRTLTTGRVTFWSRSRSELWRKGDTSGHTQHVQSVALDCDNDTLLVRVHQVGAACHTGARTCFVDGSVDAVQGVADTLGDAPPMAPIAPMAES